MNNCPIILAIATFPDVEKARTISHTLVEERLAACANIIPQVESIYRWQGKIENAGEALVFYKTTAERWEQFQQRLRALHPYEVPEIVRLDIADGLPDYLKWVAESCGPA